MLNYDCYNVFMTHSNKLLTATVMALMLITFFSCQSAPKNVPADASVEELILLAQNSYDNGNTHAAEYYYNIIIQRYGMDTNSLICAKYEIAHLRVKAKKWEEARVLLEEILAFYNDPDLAQQLKPEYKKLAMLDYDKLPVKK